MINMPIQANENPNHTASVNWLGKSLAVLLWSATWIWFACGFWLFGFDFKIAMVLVTIGCYSVGWYCYSRGWDLVANHVIVATLMVGGLATMNAVAPSAQTSQLIILSVLISFVLFKWPEHRIIIGCYIILAIVFITLTIVSDYDLLGIQIGENEAVFSIFYPVMLVTSLSVLSFCLYFFINRHTQLLQQLQAEALRAEEAATIKSRFLSNMSHEIRTPINGIFGVLQVLRNNSSLSQDQRQLLDAAISSSRQLSAIVDDVLDMSKLESGKMRLEIEPFDIRLLLKDIQTLFSSQLKQKALALNVSIARTVPKQLMGDSLRIAQIFNNVIGNAVKFTLHGEVNVQVDYASGILKISVSDTGIGMSAKTLESLFERFTQADDSIKKHFKGTGLGMAITREFIEMMQGSVVVESVEGQGTTFFIDLPLTASTVSFNIDPQNSEAPNLDEYKILVVEDNPLNHDVCLMFLRPTGAKLLVAKDGVEAIRLLQNIEVDLLLTDIAMPEMAGDDLLVEARKIYPQLPAVAMTGNVDLCDIDRYHRVGFNDILSKPLNRNLMLKIVANQLALALEPEKSVTSVRQ
jgi:two-component system, sensor histidine kinase